MRATPEKISAYQRKSAAIFCLQLAIPPSYR
jgi:hypothetical protein